MATMIPKKPRDFPPASQEGIMFEALEKLPDEYYVFHSFRITDVRENIFHESETDFIIFHKEKGIICLEAKAGHVRYEDGCWLYGSGIPMHNGGPFNQASSNKWKLIKHIETGKMADVIPKCKFLHAVWFPSISNENLKSMSLPAEGDKSLVLTKEALENPEPFLERIFSLELPVAVKTSLTAMESQRLIKEVFCPRFNVFPTASFDADLKKMVFHRLLHEQAAILNFLDEQKTAVINGAAGTGKTMIAVEKARRHASAGEKVLFLCYNVRLKEFLAKTYEYENVEYYTVSGLACKLCRTSTPDFKKFENKLEEMYVSGSFPYDHVIIDEGQDFGMEVIEEADILETIKDIVTDEEGKNGTFYVFYDKLQLIQARSMPKFIEDADCRLTLYRNCRNTENIAVTSLKPITERKPKLFEGAVKGVPAHLYFCTEDTSVINTLDQEINSLKDEGFKDIVILTCKTEMTSVLHNKVKDGLYRNKYVFSTCRKFKGLEADIIILIDVDRTTFDEENVLLYYVGSSRARIRLEIISELTSGDCTDILQRTLKTDKKIKRPQKDLADALNALGRIV